ncbi:MAG: hypothetical protein JNN04_04890 [Cyclobacteriaceae bacterium]|nr:hypothetical protein [Cyclobacteriaceae bacterium]
MIKPFKKTLYNCKQATLLSVKREEGRISLVERVSLAYHLLHCEPCRKFIAQWLLLKQSAPPFEARSLDRPAYTLPREARERIQQQLNLLNS